MRTLFLFFLLINAIYFYFQSDWYGDQNNPVLLKQQNLPEGVDRLTLLRERGLGAKSAEEVTKSTITKLSATSEKVVPEPVIETAKTATIEQEQVQQRALTPKAEKPERVKSAEAACFTFGPFSQASAASRAAEAISALGVTVKRRQVSQRTPRGYWVFMPPLESYADASQKVKEMKQKGIEDLFIMGKGNRMNAISLGLFKSKGAAEDRYERVTEMGFKVELETQYRVNKQAWLDITVSGGETVTVAAISEMAEDYPKTNLTQRKCE